jgi:hypothetical protein
MLMSQCFSGAFASAIFTQGADKLPGGNVCGYFSTTADRKAHGCYPEASGKQFATYTDRWRRALDDLRQANLSAFQATHPEWRERIETASLKALDADGRRNTREELLDQLARFTRRDPEREVRLRDLEWNASEAKAGRYRADVRLAAVLRMRTLLSDLAGRH